MKLIVAFSKFTKIWKDLQHRTKDLFLFGRLDVQNNFIFPTSKNSQKWIKIQKLTDNYWSFDGKIQENIDLSDIYQAVQTLGSLLLQQLPPTACHWISSRLRDFMQRANYIPPCVCAAQWFQMAETRQKKFTYSDVTNFSNQISANSLEFRFRSFQVL